MQRERPNTPGQSRSPPLCLAALSVLPAAARTSGRRVAAASTAFPCPDMTLPPPPNALCGERLC